MMVCHRLNVGCYCYCNHMVLILTDLKMFVNCYMLSTLLGSMTILLIKEKFLSLVYLRGNSSQIHINISVDSKRY